MNKCDHFLSLGGWWLMIRISERHQDNNLMVGWQINDLADPVVIEQADDYRPETGIMGCKADILGCQAEIIHEPVAELGGILIIIIPGFF